MYNMLHTTKTKISYTLCHMELKINCKQQLQKRIFFSAKVSWDNTMQENPQKKNYDECEKLYLV